MKQQKDAGERAAVLGSVTQAMKAQAVLAAAAIPSTVVKWEASSRLRGCVYGVRFAAPQMNNVKALLLSARIAVKEWREDG